MSSIFNRIAKVPPRYALPRYAVRASRATNRTSYVRNNPGVVAMVLIGAFAELGLVWDAADLFMGFLCLTNLFAVARLGKYAFIALDDTARIPPPAPQRGELKHGKPPQPPRGGSLKTLKKKKRYATIR